VESAVDVARLKSAAFAIIEYLLGFIALAVFVAYAYANGMPTVARWEAAFKLGAVLAAVEMIILYLRKPPMNRLILGGNIWLLAGGLAFLFGQESFLRVYERLGEISVFVSILIVGIFATIFTKSGFICADASRQAVITHSLWLIAAVIAALCMAIYFKGDVKLAAVLPLTALAFLNRYLRYRIRKIP
jgi:hypothetical protein